MRVPFQRENRFVAYLERKWRWIPICKYPSRYDVLSYKQKNIPPVANMHTCWHEEIMPNLGNSIRGAWPYSIARFSRLASLSILRIPPLVASGCKTAKYRNPEYPQKPGKEENRGTSQEKDRTVASRPKMVVPDALIPCHISYTWNHILFKFSGYRYTHRDCSCHWQCHIFPIINNHFYVSNLILATYLCNMY